MSRTLLCCMLTALAVALPAAAEEMTADEVIALNLEARGGAEKLAAVETARITGTRTMGPGMEAPFTMEWKRPNKARLEFEFGGQTGVQAYDGETAWMHMPFMGQTGPEKMPEDAAEQFVDQVDFEGPLVDYAEKGHQVEYLGLEDVEGTPAHALKVTKKSGDVMTFYLDADAHLEFKAEQTSEMNGQQVDVDITFGDYKQVEGLAFAHAMEITMDAPGMAQQPPPQHMTFETIELNVDIPDSRFEMPETEPAAGDGE